MNVSVQGRKSQSPHAADEVQAATERDTGGLPAEPVGVWDLSAACALGISERREVMVGFFAEEPGSLAGVLGLGRALVDFFSWEISSGRLADGGGSPWWSAVNGYLVMDLAAAGRLTGRDMPIPRSLESAVDKLLEDGSWPAADAWVMYVQAAPAVAQRRLWMAHDASIGGAALKAASLLGEEGSEEQGFIELVLRFLEQTSASCQPTASGLLGSLVRRWYPGSYPITASQLARIRADALRLARSSEGRW